MKILIAFLFTVNLFGNVSPDYITTNYYDPSVVISFENWKSETLAVKILTNKSEIIFNDKLNTADSEGVKYNLKNLESGKYTIKLENDHKLVEETVILFNGKIAEKEAKVYYKPYVKIQDDMINVSFLSFDGQADVSISKNGKEFFNDTVTNQKPFNKVYNVNKLEKGTYTLKVNNSKVSKITTFEVK